MEQDEEYTSIPKRSPSSNLFLSGEIHRRIRSRVVQHLTQCSGNAVIIVDEVQKMAPGALDALMPGLGKRGSFSYTVNNAFPSMSCKYVPFHVMYGHVQICSDI